MNKSELHVGQKVLLRYRETFFDHGQYETCLALVSKIDPEKRKGILVSYWRSVKFPADEQNLQNSTSHEKWVTGKSIIRTWVNYCHHLADTKQRKMKQEEKLAEFKIQADVIHRILGEFGIECKVHDHVSTHPFMFDLENMLIIHKKLEQSKKKRPSRKIV